MKVHIKNIFLLFSLLSVFPLSSENSYQDVKYGPEKKEFDSEEYNRLRDDVHLIEEVEQKNIHEDSSEFGIGYGVEKGDSYTIYINDSISGEGQYFERNRGSGAKNFKDGVQTSDPESFKRKEFQRKIVQERLKNRKSKIEDNKLKKKKNQRYSSGGEFFKFVLILVIAIILGAVSYLLFVKAPLESSQAKITYNQEMNPDAIQLSELELNIKKAKDLNDYRLATRLYFAWVIKELSDKGYIKWKKRKTNYHYFLELENTSFSEDFKVVTKSYEFVWYGKYDVLFSDFEVIENTFKVLIRKIN